MCATTNSWKRTLCDVIEGTEISPMPLPGQWQVFLCPRRMLHSCLVCSPINMWSFYLARTFKWMFVGVRVFIAALWWDLHFWWDFVGIPASGIPKKLDSSGHLTITVWLFGRPLDFSCGFVVSSVYILSLPSSLLYCFEAFQSMCHPHVPHTMLRLYTKTDAIWSIAGF